MTSRSCHTGFLHSALVRNLAASFSIATRAQVASFRQQLQAIISRLNHSPTWVAHAPADDKAICPKRGKGVLATNHLLHVEQMMSDLSEQSSGRGKYDRAKFGPLRSFHDEKTHMFCSYLFICSNPIRLLSSVNRLSKLDGDRTPGSSPFSGRPR